MTQLRPSQIASNIRLMVNKKRPLFIWGGPGLSKSAVTQQVATALNKAFVDVRLSQMDPTDLRGMPYRVEEMGLTTGVAWSPPLILPRDLNITQIVELDTIEREITFESKNPKGSNGIHYVKEPEIIVKALDASQEAVILTQSPDRFTVKLVAAGSIPANLPASGEDRISAIDAIPAVAGRIRYRVTGKAEAVVAFEELNSAPQSVLASCYQIVLDRRQGEYVVPEGVSMVAMGNRETDKGIAFPMPTPLANRFTHVEMVHNFEDWQDWAVGHGVHPAVVGYLSHNKGELYDFDAQKSGKAFATPRSWHFVSDIITDSEDLPTSEINALIQGTVGMGVGAKFAAHRKLTHDLPKPEDIMSGRVKKLELKNEEGKNIAIHYSLTTSLCYELRIQNDRLHHDGIDKKSKDSRRKEWYQGFDNVLKFWMTNFSPEVCVMGMRVAASVHNLPIDETYMPTFNAFVEEYAQLIEPNNGK